MAPPVDPALCAVELHPSVNAVAGSLVFIALPNQVIGSRVVDTTPIVASVTDSSVDYYTASLVRKGMYRIKAPRFPMDDLVFTVPDTASANLADLLVGARAL
jgi:hypothetical protein